MTTGSSKVSRYPYFGNQATQMDQHTMFHFSTTNYCGVTFVETRQRDWTDKPTDKTTDKWTNTRMYVRTDGNITS